MNLKLNKFHVFKPKKFVHEQFHFYKQGHVYPQDLSKTLRSTAASNS